MFIAASPTIETPARAADPAPVYADDDRAERLLQIQLDRASRERGISGLGPVEVVPDRSQPRQPKKTEAQPTAPAKKPATKAPVQPPVKASGNLQAVVSFALRQQGKPYIWGASGPAAYDCSGLLVASFLQIGIRLPHQSEQIAARGHVVARSQLRAGDVLAWPGHVALALGHDDLMVHASRAGVPVKVATIYGSPRVIRIVG